MSREKSLSECFRPLTPEEAEEERQVLLQAIAKAEARTDVPPEVRPLLAAGWRDILADLEAGELEIYDPGEDGPEDSE